jgi:capsular exopolysaccharide synthesis family protein
MSFANCHGHRRPRAEEAPLQKYLQTLRERFGLVVGVLAVTIAAALLYLAVTDKVYEAEAEVLVSPVGNDDPVTQGLPLIRESNDPTRDVETAARLVTGRNVAERVRRRLKLTESATELVESVDAAPVAQSNIVAVTGDGPTPERARDLTNGFARGVVSERTTELRRQIDQQLPGLRQRALAEEGTALAGTQGSARTQLAQLERLRATGDPTLRLQTSAVAPSDAASPRPVLTIAAGILGGLVIGVGAAFVLQALDPRLRREEQLRELYSLPILARIPNEKRASTFSRGRRRFGIGPRRKRRRALGPRQLSPITLEAYRTLRGMLAAGETGFEEGRSLLVTGASPSEGKTTSAINLASSLALAGNRVILIEADFRRPTMAEALGVRPTIGIGKVLLGNAPLREALVPVTPFGDTLKVLAVDRAHDALAEVLSLPAATRVLAEARQLADFVVVDSPPLTEVVDALPLARQVDEVLLVVRMGSSNLTRLQRLGDLLAQNGITPTGFVVVGVGSSEETSYYLSAREQREALAAADELEDDAESRSGGRVRSSA